MSDVFAIYVRVTGRRGKPARIECSCGRKAATANAEILSGNLYCKVDGNLLAYAGDFKAREPYTQNGEQKWRDRDDFTREEEEPQEEIREEEIRETPREEEPKDTIHPILKWLKKGRHYQGENGVRKWGYRQAERAAMLLSVGFPESAIKDSFLIDADDEMRHVLSTRTFDFINWGRTMNADNPLLAIVEKTAEAGVNACTIGDAGVGKTTVLRAYAEKHNKPYSILSCSPTGTRSKLFGILTPGIEHNDIERGFTLSSVSKLLLRAEKGEKVVIIIDEADALAPDDAIDMNAMLANGEVDHPYLGRSIKFGDNVQFFAAMNTTGNGADEDFTGRDKQDAAFIDRFFRFRVELDDATENRIFDTLLKG